MAFDIAVLKARIETMGIARSKREVDSFRQSAKRATTGMRQLERTTNQVVRSLILRMTMMAGGMIGLRSVTRQISEFGLAMSRVSAVTRATQDEFRLLEAQARHLGGTTERTAVEVAQGMTYLAMAGFGTDKVLKSISATLDLSTIATMDLGQAADITSNIMTGFGISADRTRWMVDVMAATVTRSNTNIQQLGKAMSFVASAAKTLNVSVEETAAGIGVLSNAGIQGARSGTNLRSILGKLLKDSDKNRKVLEANGLTLKMLNPMYNDLETILQRLADSTLTAADYFVLFGQRMAGSAIVLKDNLDKYRELLEVFKNSSGASQEMVAKMRDNLHTDILTFKSAVADLVLEIGEQGLTGRIRGMFQWMTNFTRGISAMGGEFKRIGTHLKVMGWLFAGWLAVGILKSARALKVLRWAMMRTGLLIPIVLIGELVYWMGRLSDATGGIKGAFKLLWKTIKAPFEVVGKMVSLVFVNIDILGARIHAFAGWLTHQFEIQMSNLTNWIVNAAEGTWNVLKEIFRSLPGLAKDGFFGAINWIISGIETLINKAISGLNSLMDSVRGPLSRLGIDVGAFESVSLGRIETEMTKTIDGMGERMRLAWRKAFAHGDNLIDTDSAHMHMMKYQEEFNEYIDGLKAKRAELRETMFDPWSQMKNEWGAASENIKKAREQEEVMADLDRMLKEADEALNLMSEKTIPKMKGELEDLPTVFGEIQNGLAGLFEDVFDLVDATDMKIRKFTDALKATRDLIKEFLNDILRMMARNIFMNSMGNQITMGMGNFFQKNLGVNAMTQNELPQIEVPSASGGGYTGSGPRSGGLDGRGGFPAILHPNESVIDHSKGPGMGTKVYLSITTESGNEIKTKEQTMNHGMIQKMDARIVKAVNRDLMRGGETMKTMKKVFGAEPRAVIR